MKKIGIITLYGNDNYGNKLQNLAVQVVCEELGYSTVTIKNAYGLNNKYTGIKRIKKYFGYVYHSFKKFVLCNKKRLRNFKKFNKNINYTKKLFTIYNISNLKCEYYIVGSDQVWKPTYGRLSDMDLLKFADNNKKISFAASFGIDELPQSYEKKAATELKKFKNISVREEAGKKIIEKITGRKDVEVLVDPTMLLTIEKWNQFSKKPVNFKSKKYILNYFLGNLSVDKEAEIKRIANENNCEIINLLDKNSPFYMCGPSEFLYLEKNAFLICTDSFHSSVFAFLYNKPFVIFEREQSGMDNMWSRMDTFLNKFKLKDRKYNGKNITQENLKNDYTASYEILVQERKKAIEYLKKSLN